MMGVKCGQKVVDRKTTEEQMDMLGLRETDHRCDGVVVRASALLKVDLGVYSPCRVIPKDFKKWYLWLPCLALGI